jgi:hypothetical protein
LSSPTGSLIKLGKLVAEVKTTYSLNQCPAGSHIGIPIPVSALFDKQGSAPDILALYTFSVGAFQRINCMQGHRKT